MDLTPNDAIREHFHEVEDVDVLGEFPHRRGNYRISFENGEVSDWNIQFDQDNGEVLDAFCFNQVI
jgi:hypothetical protein